MCTYPRTVSEKSLFLNAYEICRWSRVMYASIDPTSFGAFWLYNATASVSDRSVFGSRVVSTIDLTPLLVTERVDPDNLHQGPCCRALHESYQVGNSSLRKTALPPPSPEADGPAPESVSSFLDLVLRSVLLEGRKQVKHTIQEVKTQLQHGPKYTISHFIAHL